MSIVLGPALDRQIVKSRLCERQRRGVRTSLGHRPSTCLALPYVWEHRRLACGAPGRLARAPRIVTADDIGRDARWPHRQDACAPIRQHDTTLNRYAKQLRETPVMGGG